MPTPPLTYRPGPMPPVVDQQFRPQLDTALKAAFDNTAGLQQQMVTGALNGLGLASGVATVLGSQKGIATGLATVSNVVVSIDSSAAIFEIVTAQPTPNAKGRIDIYAWKATANNNVTPIASTTSQQVRWIAIGTPISPVAP